MADIYPQWFQIGHQMTGVTYKETVKATPVLTASNVVMEILGVQFDLPYGLAPSPGVDSVDVDAAVEGHLRDRVSTSIGTVATLGMVDTCKPLAQTQFAEGTETGGAGIAIQAVEWHDFASSGRGFLFAGRNLHFGTDGGSTANEIGGVRVLYRLVKIPPTEITGLLTELLG